MIEEFCYEDFKHSDDKMVLILLKNYIEFVEKRNLSMINGLLKNSFDTFRIDCKWYLDEAMTLPKNNSGYGSIEISPTSKKVIFNWQYDAETLTFIQKSRVLNLLYGVTPDNVYIKVEGLSLISSSTVSGDNHEEYYVKRCVFSKIPFSNKQNFDELYLETTSSSAWLPILSPYVITGNTISGKISIEKSNIIFLGRFYYKDIPYRIRLEGRVIYPNNFENNRSWKIKFITDFIIKRENGINDSLSIDLSQRFANLLSIILGPQQDIKSINLLKDGSCQSVFPELHIVPNIIKYTQMEDYIFSFTSFSNSWNTVLDKWFNMNINFKLLVDDFLLTSCIYTSNENNLINLCQGIDSFDTKPYKHLFKKIKDMINSLPENIINILKKNNNIILRDYYKKLEHSKKDLLTYLRHQNIKSDDYIAILACMIKDTRVYYMHGNLKKKLRVEDTENLKRLTNLFKFLVRCFILEQLGYDKLNRSEVSQYLCDLINPLPF